MGVVLNLAALALRNSALRWSHGLVLRGRCVEFVLG